MKNTFENALKYVRHLDSIEHTWSESEKTLATAMLSYAAKTSEKSDCISNVSNCSHEWKSDTFDHMGFCLTEYCNLCDETRDTGC